MSFILARLQYNLEVSREIFEKSSYIKFYENPSKRSRVIPWTEGQRDMRELIVAFVNFAGSPTNVHLFQAYFIIKNQREAAFSSFYLMRDHSTCFGCSLHPSSGVHKTVVMATGTSHVLV